MVRYHDWHLGKVPDFWTNFYKHKGLIEYFSYMNNVLASKSGGYSLLNFYDVLDVSSHAPGITYPWTPLETLSYVYNHEDDHPHQYLISDEILSMESIYDKHADPTVELHPDISFRLDTHPIGYVDPSYLLKFSVIGGTLNGSLVQENQSEVIELRFVGDKGVIDDNHYRYIYELPPGWTDLSSIKHLYTNTVYNREVEFRIVDGYLLATHELPRYPGRLCLRTPLPTISLVVDAAHKGATYVDRDSEEIINPCNARVVSGLYMYDIPEIYSAIYELSDPIYETVYKAEDDFIYDSRSGTIAFKSELPLKMLYVSKFNKADFRLNDDFGQFLGYHRYDSKEYRDGAEVLTNLFYGVPTKKTLISAFNVMLNQPVAKYGNDKILSMANGKLVTDKYEYKFGETPSSYTIGDIVPQYEPFGRAVSISLWDPSNPLEKWWEKRPVELFQKYSNTPLTDANKNILMDSFLRHYVGHVRVDIDEIDRSTLVFNKDVWETILDGMPARSDFILSSYKGISTLGGLSVPNITTLPGWGLHLFSVWSKYRVCDSPEWLYPPSVVKHRIEEEGLHYYPWYIGSRKYHILNKDCEFDEFWRDGDLLPYVEPNFDSWWYQFTTTPPPAGYIVSEVMHVFDGDLPQPSKSRYFPRRSDGYSTGNTSTTKFDAIPSFDMRSSLSYASIPPEIICGKADMHEWMLFDTRMTARGIECNVNADKQKYAITDPIDIGFAPKNIQFEFFIDLVDTQQRTWIAVEYGQEGTDHWTILPPDNTVMGVTGKLFLKFVFYPHASVSPVLSGYHANVFL